MALRDELMTSHEQFRRLAEQHTQYATQIDAITGKHHLSDDDKLEEVRLKKLKLKVKDQMEMIERSFKTQHHVA